MFCNKCGGQNPSDAQYCSNCGTFLKPTETIPQISNVEPSLHSPQSSVKPESIPDGIKGWSWGAFLLNWVWAIGNRTWWGLLALIPYVGLVVAIWLGIKGREMAWRNRRWDNIEHFNRVQKRWSQWGVGVVLVFGLGGGILAAIAIPAYQDYVTRAKARSNSTEMPNISSTADYSLTPDTTLPPTAAPREEEAPPNEDELWTARLQATAELVNKNAPVTIDKHTRMDTSVAGPGRKFTYNYTLVTLDRGSIDESMLESFSETIKRRTCTSKEMKEFLQNRTVLGFRYSDKDGNFIKEIEVRPSYCGYLDS